MGGSVELDVLLQFPVDIDNIPDDINEKKYIRPIKVNKYSKPKHLIDAQKEHEANMKYIENEREIKHNSHKPCSIYFYDNSLTYPELSNMYEGYPINAEGNVFPTAEHYYQWSKFSDPIIRQRIIQAPTPRIATEIAKSNRNIIKPDFDKEREMLKVLRAKFQDENMASRLRSTGTNYLVEHNAYDSYWSDGGDGSGENRLGILLQKVRSEL